MILTSLFEKRENLSRPTDSFISLFGQGTHTNQIINPDIAMKSSAIFGGIRVIAESAASLPLHLFKRTINGKEKALSHPLYHVLHTKPNPYMGAMAFREALITQMYLYGTAYAEIERNVNAVVGLYPLLSKNMRMSLVGDKYLYLYTIKGKEYILDDSRIFRISGFSSTGLVGYSPILQGKEAIALSMALEEYAARFFGNGAKPASVLEHPGELSSKAKENLRRAWAEQHQGLSNAHRMAVLEEGMKLHEYGINPDEAQAIDARKFQIEEVCRLLNIPPHMLKHLDKASFSNIEKQSLEFVQYCLMGLLVRIEQALTTQLLTDKEIKKYYFEHNIKGLLRADVKTQNEAYALGRQWGYLSVNDIREMENENKIANGDVYLQPMNMVDSKLSADSFQDEDVETVDAN
jgi:HK97 family phage portal protein